MKNVVLLGSTGSIGTSTAKVAEDLPGDIHLVGLAAGGNDALLAEQANKFQPELVSISSPEKAEGLRSKLDGISALMPSSFDLSPSAFSGELMETSSG